MATATMIGTAMRNLRRTLGLRQEDLAERIFVARETISAWERGHTSPSHDERVSIVSRLADAPPEVLGPLVAAFGIAPPPGLGRPKAAAVAGGAVLTAIRAAADELDVPASALSRTLSVVLAHLAAVGASLDDAAAVLTPASTSAPRDQRVPAAARRARGR
jgi:transcriptional regulator with XRE-family HTH domain